MRTQTVFTLPQRGHLETVGNAYRRLGGLGFAAGSGCVTFFSGGDLLAFRFGMISLRENLSGFLAGLFEDLLDFKLLMADGLQRATNCTSSAMQCGGKLREVTRDTV